MFRYEPKLRNEYALFHFFVLYFIILLGHSQQTLRSSYRVPKMNEFVKFLAKFMGPRKAKQEVKFKNPLFTALCTPGYPVQASPSIPCCPPKKLRAKAHRPLGNCDRMCERTDFSTISAKKAQKGRYLPKSAIKGERNGLFEKGRKKASTFGKELARVCSPHWPRSFLISFVHLAYAKTSQACLVMSTRTSV